MSLNSELRLHGDSGTKCRAKKRQSRKAAKMPRSGKAAKPQSRKDATKPQSRKATKPQRCHGAAKPQSRKDATEPQSRKAAKVVRAQSRSKTQNQKTQWSVRSAVVSPEWCPLTQASPSVAKLPSVKAS